MKPLRCDQQIEEQTDEWVRDNCVPDAEKVRVFVNSNLFYFNITGSATFEDILFDGINQFS